MVSTQVCLRERRRFISETIFLPRTCTHMQSTHAKIHIPTHMQNTHAKIHIHTCRAHMQKYTYTHAEHTCKNTHTYTHAEHAKIHLSCHQGQQNTVKNFSQNQGKPSSFQNAPTLMQDFKIFDTVYLVQFRNILVICKTSRLGTYSSTNISMSYIVFTVNNYLLLYNE
jgi:hypothetical protein